MSRNLVRHPGRRPRFIGASTVTREGVYQVGGANFFDRAYVINLVDRKDRRRQMGRMLRKTGLDSEPGWISFFPAVRTESADGFPSRGAHGCFLSHLGVLKRALADNLANVLIMEDDLEIDPRFKANLDAYSKILGSVDWTFAYFGHVLAGEGNEPGGELRPTTQPIVMAHFYAVNGPHLAEIVRFLEAILGRPPGHPEGGPMHLDGAYSTFRQRHPENLTLAAHPSLGRQRPSRSDITGRWFDKTPVLRGVAGLARQVAGVMSSLRKPSAG